MAIFRGGVKIFGSDVRLGLRRDRSLDNILLDPRFRDIEGGQQPDNPNLISTKAALINQMPYQNFQILHPNPFQELMNL